MSDMSFFFAVFLPSFIVAACAWVAVAFAGFDRLTDIDRYPEMSLAGLAARFLVLIALMMLIAPIGLIVWVEMWAWILGVNA